MFIDKIIRGKQEDLEEKGHVAQEGFCKFCGQMVAIFPKDGETWSSAILNECASEMCECNQAILYRERKAQKERAAALIYQKFYQNNNPDDSDSLIPEPDKVTKILECIAEAAVDGIICKANIKITPTVKADIVITASEKIKIEKTVTHKDSDEA